MWAQQLLLYIDADIRAMIPCWPVSGVFGPAVPWDYALTRHTGAVHQGVYGVLVYWLTLAAAPHGIRDVCIDYLD